MFQDLGGKRGEKREMEKRRSKEESQAEMRQMKGWWRQRGNERIK